MHFVTEEGTFVNETGTLKQTSCKWDQSFLLSVVVKLCSFIGFVQVLTTSCQKKKKKIKPEIYEVRSLKEKPGSDTNMFCDLKKN